MSAFNSYNGIDPGNGSRLRGLHWESSDRSIVERREAISRMVQIQVTDDVYELLLSGAFGSESDTVTADQRLPGALNLKEEFSLRCGETCCDPDVGQYDCRSS